MFLFWTGYTPLHHCLTMYGTAETMAMARLLLERGADPNARTGSFKQLKKLAILGLI
jgi:ankyrin repeat protein